MYYVYIIKSTIKNWYYVGSTGDVSKRINEHNAGITALTKPYAPFELVLTEEYINRAEAVKRELRVKHNHALKKA